MSVSLVQFVPARLAPSVTRDWPPIASPVGGDGPAATLAVSLGLVETAAARLNGPERSRWLARLSAEVDTLRAALAWSLEPGEPSRAGSGLRLAAALWRFWYHQGEWDEGRSWLRRVLALPAESADPTQGAWVARADALCGAGWLAFAQGDLTAARGALEESVALARRQRDRRRVALAAGCLSRVRLAQDDPTDARRLGGEAVALARSGGAAWDRAVARASLAYVEWARGNGIAAGRLLAESIADARAAGDRWLEAAGLHGLGVLSARAGDRARGVALLRESLALSRDEGNGWFVRCGLEELAGLSALAGDPARAARLLGAAERLRPNGDAPVLPDHRRRYDGAVALVRARLPAGTLAAHWAEGRALSPEMAIALALDETPGAPVGERPSTGQVPRVIVIADGRAREGTPGPPILRVSAFASGRVQLGDRVVTAADWTYAKPRELLFYLLDHPDQTKDQVGRALWPDTPPEKLRGSFHVALHHLRRVLGDAGWVRYADRRYALNRERAIWYDVAVFEDALAVARQAAGDPAREIAALERAVAAYGGDYLDALGGDWVERRRDELRRALADALLRWRQLRADVG